LARIPSGRRVGLRMFKAVLVFGAATVVFALSHWMWMSVWRWEQRVAARYSQRVIRVLAGAAGDARRDARRVGW